MDEERDLSDVEASLPAVADENEKPPGKIEIKPYRAETSQSEAFDSSDDETANTDDDSNGDRLTEEKTSEASSPPEPEFFEDEDDLPPVDDDATPVDPGALEKRWYILKAQVNRETSVCDTLRRRVQRFGLGGYFGEMLVPTEDVREFTKAGKSRIVKRKLYPGYIMVNMALTEESWWLVRDTAGIGDFTSMGGKPTPLGQSEIDKILKASRPLEPEEGGKKEDIKTSIKQKIGDKVRVKDGNFENFEGDVSAIDERNGRVTVLINIFGRLNPVELDHWQVESI